MDFVIKLLKPVNNIFKHPKVNTLLLSVVLFSIVYTILDDNHFSGVNVIKEKIKDEVIKQKIETEVKEPKVPTNETFVEAFGDNQYGEVKDAKLEQTIDEATEEAKQDVKEDELISENIEQSFIQRLFNRTYFSFTTATLLGFGDIYPVTNVCKMIVMLQAFITVGLIVF